MSRALNVKTLDGSAKYLTGLFYSDQGKFNRDFVISDLAKFTFKDEYEHILAGIRGNLAGDVLAEFDRGVEKFHKPRTDKELKDQLRKHLAIDIDGNHIDGAVGIVQLGNRVVDRQPFSFKFNGRTYMKEKAVCWPIYAGEGEERIAGRVKSKIGANEAGVDPLPDTAEPLPLGATNPNIAAVSAIAMVDALVDMFDLGSTDATIRGRVGAQPVDPDAVESGALLFTLTMAAVAFGAGSDAAPGGLASAAAIADDVSADATDTLGYCRAGSTGAGNDDLVDGEAGVSASDFNFNTLSIVSGSTVSMSSFDITQPQGATAV